MAGYYSSAGFNALVSMLLSLLLLLALMACVGAALTLPGIAGLLLTVGMGVDSNVRTSSASERNCPPLPGRVRR